MTTPTTIPGGMNAAEFLADYWQKKPLLIRQAFPGFETPLAPEEIAGMACEEGIESRLILERDGETPWQLQHGPFDESVFTGLPASHWTLLIQEVHKYVPELAELLESFRFIPNWRIDDIMVSYSPVNGSVGPHVDQYDVFLLQGLGRKRWEISTRDVPDDELISNLDLRILSHFEAEQGWELEAGDMLYLPPGVIHHGVALGDSLTYSVGFRAPCERDMISSFVDYLAVERLPEVQYSDPGLKLQVHPGEITVESIQRVRNIIQSIPLDDGDIARWFGQVVTESRNGDHAEPLPQPVSVEQFIDRFKSCDTLWRCEMSRFACVERPETMLLFVAGQLSEHSTSLQVAIFLLCDQRKHTYKEWQSLLESKEAAVLLTRLYNDGHLYLDSDYD